MRDSDGNLIGVGDIVCLLDADSPEYDSFFWIIIEISKSSTWPVHLKSLDGKYSDAVENKWIRLTYKRSKLSDLVVKF